MLKLTLYLFLLAFLATNCHQRTDTKAVSENAPSGEAALTFVIDAKGDTIPTGIAVPAKSTPVDPDSIAPPRVVPLRGKPRVTPAHPNVQPAGEPRVVPLPVDLPVVTPGKNGVSLPDTLVVEGQVVPAHEPEPVLALPPLMSKSATVDIRYLDVEQGLPGAHVRSIVQDRRGHFWLATWGKGVSKYDGRQFYQYTTESGLSHDIVMNIFEDSRGHLWFGTIGGGLSRYDGVQFTNYPKLDRATEVHHILEDRAGRIWLGTNAGLLCMDLTGKSERFLRYTISQGLSGNYIEKIFEDQAGHLWISSNGGLDRFDGSSFTNYNAITGEVLAGMLARIYAIHEDRQGSLWFGSSHDGLIRYDGQNFSFFAEEQGLSDNRILSIAEDGEGQLWLGTWQGGVIQFNPNALGGQGSFTHLNSDYGLSHDRVVSIWKDRLNNLWLGTWAGGVNIVKSDGFAYHALDGNLITSMGEGRDGNLWLGTLENGVIGYDGRNFTSLSAKEGLVDDHVFAVHLDSRGDLWAGTVIGASKFDGQTFMQYSGAEGLGQDRPGRNFVHLILEDKKGDLWLGANQPGTVSRFRIDASQSDQGKPKGNFTNFEISPTLISAAEKDKAGNLWFAFNGKLCRYDGSQFVYYDPFGGAGHYPIKDIFEDMQENLWLATEGGGVIKFSPADPKDPSAGSPGNFRRYTQRDGLKGDHVTTIAQDHRQNIWLGTESGLTVLLPNFAKNEQEYRVINLGRADGIKWLSDSQIALIDQQHRFWCGSLGGGLGMLDLERFAFPEDPPRVALDGIDIGQKFIDYRRLKAEPAYQSSLNFGRALAGAYDSISVFTNYPTSLALPHSLDHLTFRFTALDWAAPHRVEYSYLLVGQDDHWSQPAVEGIADYRNLSPGNYTFKVKAIGMAGVWSDVFEYPFRIRPPWWAAWWAFLLYGLLALYLLYQLYDYLLARRLEQAEIVRLQELDAFKTRLYTNITHEFRTPLTIVMGMARQIRDDPQRWLDEGLQMIFRNGRQLLNLVDQLLDLSKMDKGKLQLKPQAGEIVSFLRYLSRSFEPLAADKNIQLHFLKEVDRLDLDFDPDQLTKVVGNLLSNAIKFTPEDGHVYVSLRSQAADSLPTSLPRTVDEVIEIQVRDTGPGIPDLELPRIFDRFYQIDDSATRRVPGAGIGLALAKELVQLMGGAIRVQSTLHEGTAFAVVLPVNRSVPEKVVQLGPNLQPRKAQPSELESSSPLLPVLPPTPSPTLPPTEPVAVPAVDHRPVILLIEDDRDILTYLASCLEQDYQLDFARDGQAGIHRALEIVPDLIISDIMMPERDGYEVCATLKEDIRTSHIPIVLLTAKAGQDDRIAGLKSGADAYLSKPFDKEELEVRLKKLLELRRQLQARYLQHELVLKPGEEFTSKEEEFLRNLREVVEKNLADENFGAAELCWEMGMSRSQLYNKIKALTGQPASLYIRAIRLEKAKRLLLHTDLNVSEIAYESGFRTPTYFSQAFAEVVGVSPSDFRRQKMEEKA